MCFRKVEKVLRENGWVHVRTNGSHFMFSNSVTGKTIGKMAIISKYV